MNINNSDIHVYGKTVTLLSDDNPFKKGSLQFYLLAFIIKYHDSLSKYNNNENNKRLLKFLSSKKEAFYIDPWNGSKLFENSISLSIVHNIIKIGAVFQEPSFGMFAEDGLFDLLEENKFISNLPVGEKATDNIKLLWLSLYMNRDVKLANHVPKINFNNSNFSYSEKSFNISFENLPYHKIFDTVLEIPLSAFSDAWYSEDWIGLNSRGLFHHVGDHVGFYYGAKSVGQCYFLGRNQTNHLVTLSSPSRNDLRSPHYHIFSHVHPTDFVYVYGVPKGNPNFFDHPMIISSEHEDCQQNNKSNVLAAEHFWKNPVFMKNTKRKMFVGSIEDKFKDILSNIKSIFSKDQHLVILLIDKLINNKAILKKEVQFIIDACSEEQFEEIIQQSSFFMKSLAHKTVCEIINPVENLELGFFMKHNGEKPIVKKFFFFDFLLLCFSSSKKSINKPLFHMKERFVNYFLSQDKDFVNVWSDDEKKGFLFSEIVSMKNEYRIFIINNRVVATSPCFRNTVPLNAWQNGRFDPRLVNGHNGQQTHIDRERTAKYAKFARQFCKEMKEENPNCHSYVLDVAWCDEKSTVVPIEINSITWSGAYQINMHRVCSATVKSPFYYENLKTFFSDKCTNWLKLISENIISNSMFDLCGLDRTLKGKTLPELSSILDFTLHNIQNYSSVDSTKLELITTIDSGFYDTITLEEDDDEDIDNPIIDEDSKEK